MIKNLVVFGCGWTHGIELENRSNAYPSLIAKHYGWTLEDRTVPGATNTQIANNFNDWLNCSDKEYINESLVLIGLTFEKEEQGIDKDYLFVQTVTGLNKVAEEESIKMLQFNVLANQHKIKLPTLIESSSALEMLVIRDKPRKDPLFTEHKFPNEKGHQILANFLIEQITSVIIAE